jgi:Ca2+-binding RTX toxin-like protein
MYSSLGRQTISTRNCTFCSPGTISLATSATDGEADRHRLVRQPWRDLLGGEDKDWVLGGNEECPQGGHKTLVGGPGNDGFFGGQGPDNMLGGSGNDYVFGDHGSDSVLGEEGRDIVNGEEGGDRVVGGVRRGLGRLATRPDCWRLVSRF